MIPSPSEQLAGRSLALVITLSKESTTHVIGTRKRLEGCRIKDVVARHTWDLEGVDVYFLGHGDEYTLLVPLVSTKLPGLACIPI